MKNNIEPNLTIGNAETTAKQLSKYLKTAAKPVIDLSGIEKLDLAGIQLLISVQKSGEVNKKQVFFSGMLKKSIFDKLYQNGFNTIHPEDSDELYSIRRNSSEL